MRKLEEVEAALCGPCFGNPRAMAIAAVRALREPDSDMEEAGNSALSANGVDNVEGDDSTACWQAMIDQILADTEEGR